MEWEYVERISYSALPAQNNLWCVPQNYININKEIRNKDGKVLYWKWQIKKQLMSLHHDCIPCSKFAFWPSQEPVL